MAKDVKDVKNVYVHTHRDLVDAKDSKDAKHYVEERRPPPTSTTTHHHYHHHQEEEEEELPHTLTLTPSLPHTALHFTTLLKE